MVFLSAALLGGIISAATAVTSTTIGALQAAGTFDKKIKTPITEAEREERARRAAAAAGGGRSSTILTGGSLSQQSSGSGTTALLGGGSEG
jgi:hypothetical protein